MLDSTVHAQLAAILPPSALLVYARRDASPTSATASRCIARSRPRSRCPRTKRKSSRSCKACHAARIPVVARGAGTSLSGGALPDPARRRAVARQVQAHPRDRSARAHGGRAAGRAQSRDLRSRRRVRPVLRARSVVADRLLDRRQRRRERGRRALPQVRPDACTTCAACAACSSPARSSSSAARRSTAPGYDLLALITRQRGPARRDHRDHRQAAAEAADSRRSRSPRSTTSRRRARRSARSSRAGIIPAGLEMMDQAATRAVEQFVHADYPLDAAAVLLVESDGTPRGSRGGDGGDPARADASPARPRSASRRTRRSACCSGPGARRRFPRSAASRPTTTASTARSRARRCRTCCAQIAALVAANSGCRCANVFHAGDGNLHPLILFDANKPGEVEQDRSRSATASSSCASRSAARSPASTASASRSCNSMCVQFSPERARALPRRSRQRSTRTACSIPGKGVPTLRAAPSSARCTCTTASSPHPDLPRF